VFYTLRTTAPAAQVLLGGQFEFQFTYINNATAANAPVDCPTTNPEAAFTYLFPPGITNVTFLNSVGT
jgi:hypothetical protein